MTHNITTYIIGPITPDTTSVRDFISLDTRSREIGHRSGHHDYDAVKLILVREYASSNGMEYFISVEDQMGYLYGFARLCCPNASGIADRPGLGVGTAMIRELHVYGQLTSLISEGKSVSEQASNHTAVDILNSKGNNLNLTGTISPTRQPDISQTDVQHTGIGRQLMSLAEQIAQTKGYITLSVISGIGVRGYYQSLGYTLVGSYMTKDVSQAK